MKDFKLQLTNPPSGVYFPGMNVTGIVIVATDEPKDYKAIQVRIVGGAHVHWSESRGSGEHRHTQHYTSSESFVDTFIRVWDKDTSGGGGLFPTGSFQFPFSLQLVGGNLPASYDGTHGRINYKIEARIMKEEGLLSGLLKRDTHCEAYITLGNVVGINQPNLLQPLSMEVRKTICCWFCASGPIVITATVPRTGYCIQKDTIPVEVSIENGSNKSIRQIYVSIHKLVHYTAQGHHRYDNITVGSVASSGPIEAHHSTVWRPSPPLTVPDTVVTSIGCGILQVNYTLHVVGAVSWALSPVIDIPLVLGNVPLEDQLGGPPQEIGFSQPPLTGFPPPSAPSMFPQPTVDQFGGIPLQTYAPPPPTSQLPIGFVDPIKKI